MNKKKKLDINYDEEMDVLYISFGAPRKGIAIEVDEDEWVRIDPETKEIVGVTIVDFKTKYMHDDKTITAKAKAILPKIINQFQNPTKNLAH